MRNVIKTLQFQLKSKPNLIPKIILSALLFFSIVFNAISLMLTSELLINDWLVSFFQNLGTDFFGALITYLLLENIIGGWKEKLQEERSKTTQNEELEKKRFEQQIIACQELKYASNPVESQKIIDKMISLVLFKRINLSELSFNNLILSNADFTESKLVEITFINSRLNNCIFSFAYLSRVNFTSATLSKINANKAILVDANFTECIMPKSKFTRCTIQNGIFVSAKINDGIFDGTDLSYSNFSNANLENVSFAKTNLKGADFKGARLYGANLRGANLSEVLLDKYTTLPDGKQWTINVDLTLYI